MMIKADAKQLEWRVAAFLSQDTVALAEINDGLDVHEDNRQKFSLPSRLVAKTFVFRLIYGGTEYSYAQDPDFTGTSSDPSFWKRVIDAFYRKYVGIAEWHENLVRTAIRDGALTVPSGRRYEFEPYRDKRGELKWPRTTILNYPVQGFSADLMSIARVSAFKRLKKYKNVLLVNTVHDDIEIDVDNDPKLVYNVCIEMEKVFQDVPKNFERLYGVPFNVPLLGEVSCGPNFLEMEEFHGSKA